MLALLGAALAALAFSVSAAPAAEATVLLAPDRAATARGGGAALSDPRRLGSPTLLAAPRKQVSGSEAAGDVVVDALTLKPGAVSPGQSLTAQAVVRNAGSRPVKSISLALWIAPRGQPITATSGIRLAQSSLGTLPGGKSTTVVTSLSIPAAMPAGSYDIVAVVQTTQPEPAQNNVASATLEVQSAATVASSTTSATSPAPSASPSTDTSTSTGDASTSTETSSSTATTTPASTSTSTSSTTSGDTSVSTGTSGTSTDPSASADSGSGSAPSGSTTTTAAEPTSSTADCDYFAAPSGSGDGLTTSTPFRIADFWRVAAPGKTLCLMDGVYQGAAQMIRPPVGLSGTSSARITVRALNDGGVTIDGQFVNVPVHLEGNSWFLLEGFNARSSIANVIRLYPQSHNNILRRIVYWDANATTNDDLLLIFSSNNNLLEDMACFGTGKWCIDLYIGQNNRVNRFWARWEGSTSTMLARTVGLGYGENNTRGLIFENTLLTWWPGSMPQTFTYTDGRGNSTGMPGSNFAPWRAAGLWGSASDNDNCVNLQTFGMLVYVRAEDYVSSPSSPPSLLHQRGADCHTVKDAYIYLAPNFPDRGKIIAYALGDQTTLPNTNTADRVSTVVSNLGGITGWSFTNHLTGDDVRNVPSPFDPRSAGARLCHEYSNGTLTTTPLWPWRMNERIKAATGAAGRYSGPCLNCSGGRFSRKVADVTADVEAMLGPIPAACRRQ